MFYRYTVGNCKGLKNSSRNRNSSLLHFSHPISCRANRGWVLPIPLLCCRSSCPPRGSCFLFGLHSGNLGLGTATRHRGSINLMTSKLCPDGGLEKAKMTWTFRARFYCAAGDATLELIDSGNTILGTKKNLHRNINFLQNFQWKKYFPNTLVFPYIDFGFS